MELQRNNIPFVKYGGFKFLELSHIKDILSLMKICLYPKTDSISWMRALSMLKGVGKKNVSLMLSVIIDKRKGYIGLKEFKKVKFKKELVKLHNMVRKARSQKKPEIVFDTILAYYESYFKDIYGDFKKTSTLK